MQAGGCLVAVTDLLCDKHAQRKREEREQIVQSRYPIALHQMLAHQNDVAGLGIGEHFVAHIVGIGVLKTAGQREDCAEQKGLRGLKMRLRMMHSFT